MKKIFFVTIVLFTLLATLNVQCAIFGGMGEDFFYNIKNCNNGSYVTVGKAGNYSFLVPNGDLFGISPKGNDDAMLIKYSSNNIVSFKRTFGDTGFDSFYAVATSSDTDDNESYIAVGWSDINVNSSSNTGDWAGIAGYGSKDAIIVKYDSNGNIIAKQHFGNQKDDCFYDVIATKDSNGNDIYIAVGYSDFTNITTSSGSWTGTAGKGNYDAIIVTFDENLNVIDKYNFGGSDNDVFKKIIVDEDNNYIVVGGSNIYSFGNSDWNGFVGKGNYDAIIVKFDEDLNVVDKYNFGGSDYDYFNSIAKETIENNDIYVVVGTSNASSFNNNDWNSILGKGSYDAIIVKFDENLNIVDKYNFGGNSSEIFYDVIIDNGYYITIGYMEYIYYIHGAYWNGDWSGLSLPSANGKGFGDGMMVKFNNNLNVINKSYFGSKMRDEFMSVVGSNNSFNVVGWSMLDTNSSYNTGDFAGVAGYGMVDATIVGFTL